MCATSCHYFPTGHLSLLLLAGHLRSIVCASCYHYCTQFMGQTDVHKKFRLFTKFSSHFKQIFHLVLVSYSTGYHLTCVASAIITKFKTSVVPGSRLTSELYHKSWDVPNPTLFIASFDLCVCVSVFLSIFFCVCSVFNTVKHGSVFSMAKTHFL